MTKRLLLAALFTLAVAGMTPVSSAAACDEIADAATWSDNCTTYWSAYRVSDLTTGIQSILKYDAYDGWVSATDGVYGTTSGGGATPAAVKDYQEDRGIDDDGITGSVTWGKLDDSFDLDHITTDWMYYDVDNSVWRMRIKKSNSQAYIKRADGVFVRVDAWRN